MRSNKSFLLGLVLMLVCAGVAAFSGLMALVLEQALTKPKEHWTTPISIIGGSVGVFGIFLLILGVIGDPARGRTRCPKCWYDMEALADLKCPECGHLADKSSQLERTRRFRRPIIIGTLLLILGAYPVILNKRIVSTGPLAMMPTWVLMTWWDELPQSWIIRTWGRGNPGALQERMRKKWIPTSTLARFGDHLLKPMLTDKSARWDNRRITLLAQIYHNDVLWLDSRDDFFPPPPRSIDLEELLRLCALDTLDALTAEPRTKQDDQIIKQFESTELNLYFLVWSWILKNDTHSYASDWYPDQLFYMGNMRSPEIHLKISKVLSDTLPRFEDDSFLKLLSENDKDIRELAIRLTIDVGLIDRKPELFFESGADLRQINSPNEYLLGRVLHLLTPDAQEHAFGILSQWVRSDDPAKRGYAVCSIQYLQNNIGYDQSTPVEPYHQVVNDILTYAMDDDRTPFSDRPNKSISGIAKGVITKYGISEAIPAP